MGNMYELGGPTVYTFEEFITTIASAMGTETRLIGWPGIVGEIKGMVMEKAPNPIFTRDMAKMWLQDRVCSNYTHAVLLASYSFDRVESVSFSQISCLCHCRWLAPVRWASRILEFVPQAWMSGSGKLLGITGRCSIPPSASSLALHCSDWMHDGCSADWQVGFLEPRGRWV